ncbi:chemotaxis-specific protein-glutamate methyltransferase CheB [Fulvivirgaceae bacterium BMA12]|uniref:Protein-glutamate methylesterase/protein-glutamine glutaminase n=1 Tax=Agaribacillus aureus TaxID=3051825 RepID=A0ABT8L758_9BACT|nr:chemotaxis-specific protein-glutamate methyltransferase CheB [Fulvivirgaceae bacterium BMA12]
MKDKIKILVVEDLGLMRLIISNMLSRNAEIEVVGAASNGKEGFEKALQRKPDVIVSDMVMPEYDGLHLVKAVMESIPTPIILVSALEKDSPQIFEALQAGAFDFVDKPGSQESRNADNDTLIRIIKEASKVDLAKLQRKEVVINQVKHDFPKDLIHDIAIIGASTGGTSAIETIIGSFPKNLPIPIIIAQQTPQPFLESFAKRLNGLSPIPVKLAENKEIIVPGKVYVAPGWTDMVINRASNEGEPVMEFTSEKLNQSNVPSIDRLLESATHIYGEKVMGILLTGIGADGAQGLACVNERGGFTIAQNEASSLVFSKPKAAIDLGVVKKVADLADIPGLIVGSL